MAKELGKKIKSIRLKRNLSQTEMAEILGYSGKGMISRLENDSADMSYDKLMILLSRFSGDFEGETIEAIVPSKNSEKTISTKRLIIKPIGFKELDDALSLKVHKFQRDFVAENALAIAEAYAAQKEGTKTECFVAYENELPIGFVSVAFGSIGASGEKEWMNNSYYLWRIMVDMNYQNKGYGTEIITAIIDWCKSMPLGQSNIIFTSSDSNNKNALSFYQKNGFVRTDDYVDDEIVLRRDLKEEN